MGGSAFYRIGLALPDVALCLMRGGGTDDLRQTRIEPCNSIVKLSGDCRIAAGRAVARERIATRGNIAARFGLGDPLDLASDSIEPLMNVGNLAALLAKHRLAFIVGRTEIGRY